MCFKQEYVHRLRDELTLAQRISLYVVGVGNLFWRRRWMYLRKDHSSSHLFRHVQLRRMSRVMERSFDKSTSHFLDLWSTNPKHNSFSFEFLDIRTCFSCDPQEPTRGLVFLFQCTSQPLFPFIWLMNRLLVLAASSLMHS